MVLLLLLLGCPASDPVQAPAPGPAPEPPASIPLGYLETPSAVVPAEPRPTVIPRDPWPEPEQFGNQPPRCKEFGAIAPSPSEDGQWAAVRLEPPETPFKVDRVEVVLAHGTFNMSQCDAAQRYRMRLYVVPSRSAPPDGKGTDPATPHEYDFFARRDQAGERALSAVVSPSVVLNDGEALIVAVDTHNPGGGARTCIKTCLEGDENGRTYWSNARAPEHWAWTAYDPARGTGMWAIAEGFGP